MSGYGTGSFHTGQEDSKMLQSNIGPRPWDLSPSGDTGHFAHTVGPGDKYSQHHMAQAHLYLKHRSQGEAGWV